MHLHQLSQAGCDLTIAKVALQTSVEPGDIVVFRITVSNAADAGTARDVIVTDPLPVGVTYEGSEDDRCEPDGTTCAVGDLGPGAAVSFTVSYRLDAASELDLVRNEAIVSSPDDPGSPPAEDDTLVVRPSIIKAGFEPFFGKIGDSLTYTYLVTNTGGADLTGVTVADDRIASSSIDCNGDAPGTGQPFALAPSETRTCSGLLLRGGRGRDRQVGEQRRHRRFERDRREHRRLDDSAGAPGDRQIRHVDRSLCRGASKSSTRSSSRTRDRWRSPTSPSPTRSRNSFAPAAVCTPPAPVATLAVAARITCSATRTVSQADLDKGSVLNVATADSVETPEVSDEVTVPTPDPSVDLAITKRTVGAVQAGATATYELTVTNNGPATARDISVTDTLPAAMTFVVPAAGDGWACSGSGPTVACTTTAVAVKGSTLPAITVRASVSATATGSVINTAEVRSTTQTDRDPTNNKATVTDVIPIPAPASQTATRVAPVVARAVLAPTRNSTRRHRLGDRRDAVRRVLAAGVRLARSPIPTTYRLVSTVGPVIRHPVLKAGRDVDEETR